MASFDNASLFSVKGKVALITGGSRGIGRMIATGLVKNGAKVYISARSADVCHQTAKELTEMGPGQCISLPANMQTLSDVDKLVAELTSREKELHILVNNAGATWGASIDDYPDNAVAKVLTLNVQRVFTLTQKLLPLLRAGANQGGKTGESFNDPSRIINIGSVEGERVPDNNTYAYSASKAALHHLSRHMAGRLGWEGITSNTIACGPFQTKMMAETLRKSGDKIVSGLPLQRIGTDEDVAGTVIFLSSRAGSYVNGATIALDGGVLSRMQKATAFAKL